MIKEDYEKNFLLLVFILYILFIDRVSCIINNGNIHTDGRWRCITRWVRGYAIDTAANYNHARNRF